MSLETIQFKFLDLKPGHRILDLGCGEGRHAITASLLDDVVSVGIDLRMEDLCTARKRLEDFADNGQVKYSLALSVASGEHLPFTDNSFDRVICSEVLEHIKDYPQVLEEIDRVLKPSGKLAVSVPRWWPEWICWKLSDAYHEMEGGHIRIFRAGTLINAIEAYGFTKTRKHWAHSLHVPYWWLKCLFWGKNPWILKTYHQFLVWDLMSSPPLTYWLDKWLNPLMGKSVVIYFDRQKTTATEH